MRDNLAAPSASSHCVVPLVLSVGALEVIPVITQRDCRQQASMFLLQCLQQMKGNKTTSRSDDLLNDSLLMLIPLPAAALYSERGPDIPLQLCHLFSSADVSLSCQDRVQTPWEPLR